MLHARIHQPDTWQPLLRGPVWEEVFAWIAAFDPALPDGIHPIRGEEIFVNLHRYDTQPRSACRWESHRRYLDLQYCLEGEEFIDVTDRAALQDDGSYDAEADLLFHRTPFPSAPALARAPVHALCMTPGSFAVFTPSDAHRPKIQTGTRPETVRKFVVKIPCAVAQGE